MSLRVCLGCRTLYADGLEACPHCGTRDAVYDWDDDVKADAPGAPEPKAKTAPKAKDA